MSKLLFKYSIIFLVVIVITIIFSFFFLLSNCLQTRPQNTFEFHYQSLKVASQRKIKIKILATRCHKVNIEIKNIKVIYVFCVQIT